MSTVFLEQTSKQVSNIPESKAMSALEISSRRNVHLEIVQH